MRAAITLALLCLYLETGFAKPTRSIELAESDIGQITTALGYSTILQFDARPTSVILGDQDGFKVEYVGNSLTLKPLAPGGKTNLFVFTEYERFAFRVTVGGGSVVDYVVGVKRKRKTDSLQKGGDDFTPELAESEQQGNMVTIALNAGSQCGGILLSLDSISYAQNRPWAHLTFRLSQVESYTPGPLKFKADDLTLRLNGKPLPVETLYLEKLEVSKDLPVQGSLLFQLNRKASKLQLVFSPASLKVPKCTPIKVTLKVPKPHPKK